MPMCQNAISNAKPLNGSKTTQELDSSLKQTQTAQEIVNTAKEKRAYQTALATASTVGAYTSSLRRLKALCLKNRNFSLSARGPSDVVRESLERLGTWN